MPITGSIGAVSRAAMYRAATALKIEVFYNSAFQWVEPGDRAELFTREYLLEGGTRDVLLNRNPRLVIKL